MWDTICNLPLSSDIISLATHPTEPLVAIGLASGHVTLLRIPAPEEPASASESNPAGDKSHSKGNGADSQPRRSSLTPTSPSTSNGYGTMTTLWRTRRHKGSCRSLAFSPDGTTLFSVGTDSLVKAAHAPSGHVLGKIAAPADAEPSVLCALSNKTLLMGDDGGMLHVYSLSETKAVRAVGDDDKPAAVTAHVPAGQPDKSYRPHASADDPAAGGEPITSITALPPSATSSSGTSRAWVSTSAGTLAAGDLHRGHVKLSIEQGGANGEELLASACATNPAAAVVLAADSAGLLGLWPRGAWEDRAGGVRVRRPPQQTPGIAVFDADDDSDAGIECLAVRAGTAADPCALVACGLGSGSVRFVRLDPAAAAQGTGRAKAKAARLLSEAVQHDEHRFDGVACVAFDARGRLISGGGALVKVWAWTDARGVAGVDEDDLEAEDVDEEDEEEDDDDDLTATGSRHALSSTADADSDDSNEEEDDESDSDDGPKRKRKKRRRRETTRAGKPKRGARGVGHGIGAVSGLD